MPDVETHNRKTKSGKLIQVSSHARAGEQKKKSPTMRTEARSVVDKPDKPKKPPESPKGTRRAASNSGGGNSDLSDLQKKYATGLKILTQLVINLGGIEKARENEEYQKLIKIMADRFKQLKELSKNESSEESKKEV
jgi:hypothetical protein